nr:carboxymuconolactone decarboxylase family protein [Streptosporangium sandarakinum]
MKSVANPDVITGIQHLHKAIHAGGVDPLVLELVHLRASQINGCSPCVVRRRPVGEEAWRDRGAAAQRGHLARDPVLHRGGAGGARADRSSATSGRPPSWAPTFG